MKQSIVKSVVYTPGKLRFVLAVQFVGEELLGYVVTTQSDYSQRKNSASKEHTEHFPLAEWQSGPVAYTRAAARFRELVMPTL